MAKEKVMLEDLLKNTSGPSSDICEALIEEFSEQMSGDCEAHWKKGVRIFNAYKQDPDLVDEIFITLCGWSVRSLLAFKKIIVDVEGIVDEDEGGEHDE